MLATLKNVLIKIFLSIIILSFIVWGIGDIIKSMHDDNIAKIGDQVITTDDFKVQLLKEKENLQKSFGDQFSDQQLKHLGFDKYIINKMIQKHLLLKAAQDFGFKLSDNKIAELIKKDKIFHDEQGNFDPIKFNQFLKYNHLSEQELADKLSDQYVSKILIDFLGKVKFDIKDYEKILAQYNTHQRQIEFIKFDIDNLKISVATHDQLKKFYESNQNLFMLPEKRDFNVSILDSKKLVEQIKVSEEEVKQAFEDRGYDNNQKTFNEMQSQLTKKLFHDKLEQLIDQTKNEIEDLLASGSSVKQVAEKFNLKFTNYHNLTLEDLNNKALNPVMHKAFEMHFESPREIFLDDKDNQYVIIELLQIVTPKAKEYEVVKEQVINALMAKNKKDLLQTIRGEAVASYHHQHKLDSIANKYNGKLKNITLARNELHKESNIPTTLMDELFTLNKDEISNLTSLDQKNFYFGVTKKIILAKAIGNTPQQLNVIKEQLHNNFKNELIEQYLEYLKKHYKVKVNYNLIDKFFN